MADTPVAYASCKKTAAAAKVDSLKRCAKCKMTHYCSRDCQTADWKLHKKIYGKNESPAFSGAILEHGSSYSSPRLKDLDNHVPNPFTRLDQGKYLDDRPEEDVYKLLVDSFHMRQADDINLKGKTTPGTICTGVASSIEPFRQYLAKVAARKLVPP